jgi:hypothetical protein
MDDSDNDPLIEGQPGLLPNLNDWGIDAVDIGVCEDSYENRRLLRENQARWVPVYTKTGAPTNLIQVVTVQMQQARLAENKSIILKDKKNLDSDYITGFNLTLIPQADNIVPAWALAATRHWTEVEEERQRRGKDGKVYRPALAGPPTRCLAKNLTGHRCQNWSNGRVDSNGLCRMHISNHHYDTETPGTHTLAKARARMLSASVGAVDKLEELMNATSEPVQLGAAKEILDRAGLRGGFDIGGEVKIQVVPAGEVVAERLKKLRENQAKALQILNEPASPEEVDPEDGPETVTAEIVVEDDE